MQNVIFHVKLLSPTLTKTRVAVHGLGKRVAGQKNGSRVEKNGSRSRKRVTGRKTGRRKNTGKDWVAGRKIRVKKQQSVHSKSPPSLF